MFPNLAYITGYSKTIMSDKMSYVDVIKHTLQVDCTMIFIRLSFILSLLFVFPNTIFYRIALLFLVAFFIFFINVNFILSGLIGILMAIVYIGAIMILIGYTCAICPNLNVNSNFSFIYCLPLSLLFIFPSLTLERSNSYNFSFKSDIVDYFYNFNGGLIFFTIIFMLFLILLIVTSQYSNPKGPFRSL
jgi:hypothetical protein